MVVQPSKRQHKHPSPGARTRCAADSNRGRQIPPGIFSHLLDQRQLAPSVLCSHITMRNPDGTASRTVSGPGSSESTPGDRRSGPALAFSPSSSRTKVHPCDMRHATDRRASAIDYERTMDALPRNSALAARRTASATSPGCVAEFVRTDLRGHLSTHFPSGARDNFMETGISESRPQTGLTEYLENITSDAEVLSPRNQAQLLHQDSERSSDTSDTPVPLGPGVSLPDPTASPETPAAPASLNISPSTAAREAARAWIQSRGQGAATVSRSARSGTCTNRSTPRTVRRGAFAAWSDPGVADSRTARTAEPFMDLEDTWTNLRHFKTEEDRRMQQLLVEHQNHKVLMLSHSWRDPTQQTWKRFLASRISADVEGGGGGLSYWADWLDLQTEGPVPWRSEIEEGIKECAKVVCFIDCAYLFSFNCLQEVAFAQMYNKPLVVVIMEQGAMELLTAVGGAREVWDHLCLYEGKHLVPGQQTLSLKVLEDMFAQLASINFAFCRDLDIANHGVEEVQAQLVKFVTKDLEYPKEHALLLSRALHWQASGKHEDSLLHGSESSRWWTWLEVAGAAGRQPPPTRLQREFLEASKRKRARRKALLEVIAVLALVLIVASAVAAVVLAVVSVKAKQRAEVAEENSLAAAAAAAAAAEAAFRAKAEAEKQVLLTQMDSLSYRSQVDAAYDVPPLASLKALRQVFSITTAANLTDTSMFLQAQEAAAFTLAQVDPRLQYILQPRDSSTSNSAPKALVMISWSPDGTLLATSNPDGGQQIFIWSVKYGTPSVAGSSPAILLPGDSSDHTLFISGLAWSQDGRYLAATQHLSYTTNPLDYIHSYFAPCTLWVWDMAAILSGAVRSNSEGVVFQSSLGKCLPGSVLNPMSWTAGGRLMLLAWLEDAGAANPDAAHVYMWDITRTAAPGSTPPAAAPPSCTLTLSSGSADCKLTSVKSQPAWSPDGSSIALGLLDAAPSGNTSMNICIWSIKHGEDSSSSSSSSEPALLLVQDNLPSFYLGWVYGDYDTYTDWSLYHMVAGAQLNSGPISLSWSPDSSLLASGTQQANTSVRVWNIDCAASIATGAGQCFVDIPGSANNGNALTWRFSNVSDGDNKGLHLQLAGGGSDRSVRLFEVVLGADQLDASAVDPESLDRYLRATAVQGHRGAIVSAVAFSKDGLMASADTGDVGGLVYVWTCSTTDQAAIRSPLQRGSFTFSNAQSNSHFNTTAAVATMAWSPDGRRLVSAGDGANSDPTLWMWDMKAGFGQASNAVLLLAAGDTQNWISDLAWSPDSRFLASSGDGGNSSGVLQIWDASAGSRDTGAAWSGDGGSISSSMHSRPMFRLYLPDTVPYSIAWSPDGTLLAAALHNKTRETDFLVWDLAVNASGAPFLRNTPRRLGGCVFDPANTPQLGYASMLRWSPDGRMLASGGPLLSGGASRLCVWGMTGQAAAPVATLLDSGRDWIRWVVWSSDSRYLATAAVATYPGQYGASSAGYSGTLRVMSITLDAAGTPQLLGSAVMSQLPESILSLAWSSDGRQLASSTTSRHGANSTQIKVRIWDIHNFLERAFHEAEDITNSSDSTDPGGEESQGAGRCRSVTASWEVTYTDAQLPPRSYCTGGNCAVVAFSPDSQLLAYSWLHQVRTAVVQKEAQAALLADYLGNVQYDLDMADNTTLGIQCDSDEG